MTRRCRASRVRTDIWMASALVLAAWAAAPAHAGNATAAAASASAPAPEKASPAVLKPVTAPHSDGLAVLQRRLAEKFGPQRAAEQRGADGPVLRVMAAAAPTTAARPAAVPAAVKRPPAAQAAARSGHPPHWSYEGEAGPAAWGRLKPEFAACATGQRQSPIDLRDGMKLALAPLAFDYKPSGFKVQDTGHTILVDVAPGNAIELLGQRFELQQFHFHRPSEEAIDGKRFDMVAHFVHKNAEGRLAVLAVLIERGAAQGALQQVWNHLPLETGDTVAAQATLDLAQLLPAQRGYFSTMGSLTTPPCSEGVLWLVMKQPLQASAEQISIFARLYPMNARPLQPAAGRRIHESN